MPLRAGDRLLEGKYKILKPLGRGGFSIVYLAVDTIVGREVAIKELRSRLADHSPQVDRFVTDGRLGIILRHPNIVEVYDVFRAAHEYYIAMEYLPQGSLAELLHARGRLEFGAAVHTISAACRGLAHAHRSGVVHCDVKPANILFGRRGLVKVSDFGIAHVSRELLGRSWETATESSLGTLAYMSPEQLEGIRDDPRVDVYALGAVLYEVLTGRLYLDFEQQCTPDAYVRNAIRIARQEPNPLPSSVPPWVRSVVMKALRKERSERYVDAGQMREALDSRRQTSVLGAALGPTETSARAKKARPPDVREHAPQAEERPKAGGVSPQGHPAIFALWVTLVAFLAILWVSPVVTSPPTPGSSTETPRVGPSMASVTVVPTPAGTGAITTPTRLDLLFEDNFSDSDSGWEIEESDSGSVGYQEGRYVIAVWREPWTIYGHHARVFEDLVIEVDTTLVSERAAGYQYQGVKCRGQSNGDGYLFLISGQGLCSIFMFQSGDVEALVDWTPTRAIKPQGESNHLTVECMASILSFSVNGERVAEATDSSYSIGSIALMAATEADERIEVHFDNLAVYGPIYDDQPTATASVPTSTKTPTIAPTATTLVPPPTATPLCPSGMGCIRVINTNCSDELYFTIGGNMHTISGSPTAMIQLAPGEYTYTVSTPGHESFNGSIVVEASMVHPLSFTCDLSWDSLPPRRSIQLDQ